MRMIMAIAALAAATVTGPSAAAAAESGYRPVNTLVYDLGDQAFRPPASSGYDGANELNGIVYYPADLERGNHPLIMIQHGYWQTCADRVATERNTAAQAAFDAAQQAGDDQEAARQEKILTETSALMNRWPCAPGTKPLPSFAGYDYLGRQLASRGFVVVSVGVNGINSTSPGQAPSVYYARAALINAQLGLWQQLASTGQGPLRGRLIDPRTGRPAGVDFRGHVDLTDVGTIGHSMGGGGVMQQAADIRHGEWPPGVRVRAVFALAPTDNWNGEAVTQVPFAIMWGTCDQVNTGDYFASNAGRNHAPIYHYTLTGGNHDNYNTEWSPAGGQVGAHDEAIPGSAPGTCRTQFPGGPQSDQRELTEIRQRAVTSAYVTAFFERHLKNRTDFDAVLTGRRRPPGVPDVATAEFADGL
ncbi:hypothetical protein [Amycolatopsis sp. WQ 127309]|uniref:hypothetical protein n=1 Tax=Amycolatopsis sp. WQ 127309 TaxID=2932773 RepID=UPI001FF2E69D|nr:hypothetical protein [Amycolatopsis sp. WQ 127309]UOZ03490.1 hypothetical protein MUY22_32130 [Amycolatopsis sp. WQ 127309]